MVSVTATTAGGDGPGSAIGSATVENAKLRRLSEYYKSHSNTQSSEVTRLFLPYHSIDCHLNTFYTLPCAGTSHVSDHWHQHRCYHVAQSKLGINRVLNLCRGHVSKCQRKPMKHGIITYTRTLFLKQSLRKKKAKMEFCDGQRSSEQRREATVFGWGLHQRG